MKRPGDTTADLDRRIGKLSLDLKASEASTNYGRGVYVTRAIASITKTGDEAMLLSQCLYWFEPGADGRIRTNAWQKGWSTIEGRQRGIAKTMTEWADDLGMSWQRLRSAMKSLVVRKLLHKTLGAYQGRKTTFLRPNLEHIERALSNSGKL